MHICECVCVCIYANLLIAVRFHEGGRPYTAVHVNFSSCRQCHDLPLYVHHSIAMCPPSCSSSLKVLFIYSVLKKIECFSLTVHNKNQRTKKTHTHPRASVSSQPKCDHHSHQKHIQHNLEESTLYWQVLIRLQYNGITITITTTVITTTIIMMRRLWPIASTI